MLNFLRFLSPEERVILTAVGVDFCLGDPVGFPHPVRMIGKMAALLERQSRRWIPSAFWAGVISAVLIDALVYGVALISIELLRGRFPHVSTLISVYWIYSAVALRDLITHSHRVYQALTSVSLVEARRQVAMIVGRDTENLSESQVIRACVESVSESLVDGVTAPIFFAWLMGPAGAMLYRAINTLDSIYGHRDERYEQFGKCAARIDDLANFIPARLTAPLVAVASVFIGLRPRQSLRIWLRDGRKHPSPNSGLAEAAFAGALGIQLGGEVTYQGEKSHKPFLGDPLEEKTPEHILNSNRLLVWITGLFIILLGCLSRWRGGFGLI
ncbi:MAG: adenosylcobinamide-phosphate synthase CbiB [Bdellovibrionia bacterium]